MANNVDVKDAAGATKTVKTTDNASVHTPHHNVDTIAAGDNNIGNVDIVTVPAPLSTTGAGTEAAALRVTLATDSTGLVSVDDNGGSLTVDGTVAVSGTVAVTDNAGSLTVDNGGTFAVQESGAGLTALQLIDNIVHVEDEASADGHSGALVLARRTATPANTSGADLDYEALQMSAGRLWASATIDAAIPAGNNNIGDVDVASIAAGDNNIGNVDIVSVPAPLSTTGGGTEATAHRVTIANDSTGVLSVDDNGASLTVDGTVGVSGSVAVTNAGTFATQVDGAALTSLQLIDNIVFAEDAAHVSGDSGVMALSVRKDTGAALAGTDGDYSPLQVDSSGNLRVNVAAGGAGDGSILDGVSSSIKATVLDYTSSNPLAVRLSDTNGDYVAAGAGTQYTEDAASAADPVGSMLMAVRKDTLAGITSADGDNIALRATDKGEVYVKQTDVVPVSDNSGSLTVDGTVTANLAAGTNNIGDVDVLTVPAPLSTTGNGTAATALRVSIASDTTGVVAVTDNGGNLSIDDGGNSITVDNGGTFAVQATVAAGATNIAKAEDVASADADVGVPAMAVRKATPANTSGTDGDYEMLQMSAGRLWVDPSGVTLTVASHAVTNAGTFAVQDSEKVADNAGFTDGTTKVQPVGYIFDETAGTALTENDAAAARIDTKRAQVLVLEDETTRGQRATVNSSKGLAVTVIPHTAGGLSVYHVVSAATTNAANVKASAGQLYGWHITNTNAAARYVKLHNTAGTPTAGASITMTIGLPASGGSNVSFDQGIAFGTGIGISIVTGVADSDATAVAANDVQVNLFYK